MQRRQAISVRCQSKGWTNPKMATTRTKTGTCTHWIASADLLCCLGVHHRHLRHGRARHGDCGDRKEQVDPCATLLHRDEYVRQRQCQGCPSNRRPDHRDPVHERGQKRWRERTAPAIGELAEETQPAQRPAPVAARLLDTSIPNAKGRLGPKSNGHPLPFSLTRGTNRACGGSI